MNIKLGATLLISIGACNINAMMTSSEINNAIAQIVEKENPCKEDRLQLTELLKKLPQDAQTQAHVQTYENQLAQDIQHLSFQSLKYPKINNSLIAKGAAKGFGALTLIKAASEHLSTHWLGRARYAILDRGWLVMPFLPYGYVKSLVQSNDGFRLLASLGCLAGAGYVAYKSFLDIKRGLSYNKSIAIELRKKKQLNDVFVQFKQPFFDQQQLLMSTTPLPQPIQVPAPTYSSETPN